MVYGTLDNVNLYLENKLIERVDKYKSLGMILHTVKSSNSNIFQDNSCYLNEKARRAIFGIQNKVRSAGCISPKHMLYLFETLVQPILLYGSDVWGLYNQCTKEIDNTFMWFLRGVLCVKPTTCNIITVGEAGIIPPSVKCHQNVLLNFIRLNCMPKGCVVKSVFSESDRMHDIGINCWFSRAIELGKNYGLDLKSYDYNDKTKLEVKSIIRDNYIRKWKLDLQNNEKYPLLRMYRVIKTKFGFEKYMSLIKNRNYRIALTRFRSSSIALEIERGRYTNPITPVENRLCHVCNIVEDELHFLIKCSLFDEERTILFSKISEILPNFISLADPNKFVFLLTNIEEKILTWVGKFIYESFNKRNEYYASI